MPRRGKAKSVLAPMKDLFQSLELSRPEASLFKALTLDFLTKTKRLQDNEIIAALDRDFYKFARELLERETTPGKGPTGFQYWPIDDTFQRTLTYAANPTRIIKLVSYIMRNQRKTLLKARTRRRTQDLAGVENHEPENRPGPSRTAVAYLHTDNEPVVEKREALRETSRESPEFPSVMEIIRARREAPPAPYLSDCTDPPSHLATPPITPAVSSSMQQRRIFRDDSPRSSIEVADTAAGASETSTPQRSLQPTTEDRDGRRERSPTIFAEYNPRLPTHRDGSLDEASIKAWENGVQFARDRMERFNGGLRRKHREHPRATLEEHNAALQIYHKTIGLDEGLEFLDRDMQKQRKRLNEFKASRAAFGPPKERGMSRTLSP